MLFLYRPARKAGRGKAGGFDPPISFYTDLPVRQVVFLAYIAKIVQGFYTDLPVRQVKKRGIAMSMYYMFLYRPARKAGRVIVLDRVYIDVSIQTCP